MKPVEREFGQSKNCLKFFPYQAKTVVIDENTVTPTVVGNRQIIKAGTPYPSNDAKCDGYILQDYDVTNGSQSAAVVFDGTIDNKVLSENSIVVTAEAKTATPRVTFMD